MATPQAEAFLQRFAPWLAAYPKSATTAVTTALLGPIKLSMIRESAPTAKRAIPQRLGRHVEHDPRSLNYTVSETKKALKKVLWLRHVPVFNQGEIGSCTGNALAGALCTGPFTHIFTETDAVKIYSQATLVDSIKGNYPPTDTGSSGLAVCKVAKANGWIIAYKHALSVNAALTALQDGPVITGVDWYQGFDTPDKTGLVKISGSVRGGHEFVVIGYDPATGLVEAVNSWGTTWGKAGHFFFSVTTWAELLKSDGDVTVPVPLAA